MNFKIGEKIVCIDDRAGFISGTKELIKGEIYTVIGFNEYTANGVLLAEIKAKTFMQTFRVDRFRKLDYEFAEGILEQIKEQVSNEYQLN